MSFTLMLSSLSLSSSASAGLSSGSRAAANDAFAQNAAAPTTTSDKPATPDDRATEFKAVEGGGETRSGTTLVVEAYAVLWLILMTWLFLVWRKQATLHARIDELEKVLDKAAAAAAKPAK